MNTRINDRIVKASIRPIGFLMIAVCLASAAVAQESATGDDTEIEAVSTIDTGGEVKLDQDFDDPAVARRLSGILDQTGWFTDLQVTSRQGVVTLRGTVDSPEHGEWAAKLSSRTEQVVATINHLQIDGTIDLAESFAIVRQSIKNLAADTLRRTPLLIAGLVIVLLTVLAAKFVRWVVHRIVSRGQRFRLGLQDLIEQLSSLTVWAVGLMTAAVVMFPGLTPAKAITVLGLGGVAIGFAFKDIFENFFAGMLILWRYPFDRGDFITTGDITGCVTHITIRNTMIRRVGGELSVVPNAQIFKQNVDVLTDREARRATAVCGVAYKEDIEAARAVIDAAVRRCASVKVGRGIEVLVEELSDSSVNFAVAWWTGARPLEIRKSRDEVISAVKSALDAAGIEIPFPHRQLVWNPESSAITVAASCRDVAGHPQPPGS